MIKQPDYKRVLFIPDIHAPFHDMKAIKCMLSFMKWYKPYKIYIMGDLIDFYAISSFVKDPQRSLRLQDELDVSKNILGLIRDETNNEIIYLKGNHEHRLQKYLWTKASELSGLNGLLLENLLEFKKYDIKYKIFGRDKYRNTLIKHGDIVRKYTCYTAKGEFENAGTSGVSGHTHRQGIYYVTNENDSYMWMECGCLCDLSQEYLQGKTPNWQQGFGIGYYKSSSERFNLDAVPIIHGKALYGGREYY